MAKPGVDWDKYPPIPGFSCLEYKWRVSEEIGAKLASMTPKEQVAYWANADRELRERLAQIDAQTVTGTPNSSSCAPRWHLSTSPSWRLPALHPSCPTPAQRPPS